MRMGFKAWIFVAAAVVAGLLLFRVSSKAQAPAAAQAQRIGRRERPMANPI